MRIINAESFRHPEAVAHALEVGTRYAVDYLTDLLRRRFAEGGDFPEAETCATSLMSMLVAPARLRAWGAQVDDEAVQKHIRHCVALFLRGILHRQEG